MSATGSAIAKNAHAPTLSGFALEVPGMNFRVRAWRSVLPEDKTIKTNHPNFGTLGPIVEEKLRSKRCKVLRGLTSEEALKLHHNPEVLVPLAIGEGLLSIKGFPQMLEMFQPFYCGTVVGWGNVRSGVLEFDNPVDKWTRIIDGIKTGGSSEGKLFAMNPVAITRTGNLVLENGNPVFQYDVVIDEHHKRTVFTPRSEKAVIVRPVIDSGESPYDEVEHKAGLPVRDYSGMNGSKPVRFYFDSQSFVGLPVVMNLNGNGSVNVVFDAILLGRQYAVLTLEPNGAKNGHAKQDSGQ